MVSNSLLQIYCSYEIPHFTVENVNRFWMASAGRRNYVPINCERAIFIVPRTEETHRKKIQNSRKWEIILFLSSVEDYFVQYYLQHFILSIMGMFFFHNGVFKNHCSCKKTKCSLDFCKVPNVFLQKYYVFQFQEINQHDLKLRNTKKKVKGQKAVKIY